MDQGATVKTQHTIEELRNLLQYDPLDGTLRWRVDRHAGRNGVGHLVARAGDVAGGLDKSTGYIQVTISLGGGKRKRYLAHRLIWAIVTGAWPSHEIDHENTLRGDNRWTNLEHKTKAGNMQNLQRARRDSRTGLQGVKVNKNRFSAVIKTAGKFTHIGTYDTPELAHAAYLAAKALRPSAVITN